MTTGPFAVKSGELDGLAVDAVQREVGGLLPDLEGARPTGERDADQRRRHDTPEQQACAHWDPPCAGVVAPLTRRTTIRFRRIGSGVSGRPIRCQPDQIVRARSPWPSADHEWPWLYPHARCWGTRRAPPPSDASPNSGLRRRKPALERRLVRHAPRPHYSRTRNSMTRRVARACAAQLPTGAPGRLTLALRLARMPLSRPGSLGSRGGRLCCAMPTAPGAPSVRVWHVTSR